jgi:hypothetical protein
MRPGNPDPKGNVLSPTVANTAMEASIRPELTPREARSGVVSGRVLTVLLTSFFGAVVALVLAWLFLFPR